MTTAALYIRVSTRQQAEEGFSLAEQQAVLTTLANDRGWDFRLYVDAGLSGERLDNRPALLEMLGAAAAGEHSIVAVVDESRLARDELTAAIIRDRLKRAGVTLVTPAGERDLSDPSGSFVATVLGAAAALEQDMRTAKTTAGLRATARAGFWPGGPAPFGYHLEADPAGSRHKVLAINEAEAAVLRDAVALVLDHGHTAWAAAKILTASGGRTRSGRTWHPANLAYQLQRSHLAGTYTYRHPAGPVTIPIPAILTHSRWQALQAAVRATPGPKERTNHFYPLSGYLVCACGASISGIYRRERHTRHYKCSHATSAIPTDQRCPHYPRHLPADRLETQVWAAIYQLLCDPDRLRQAAQRHIAAATQGQPQQANQRATLTRRLDHLDLEETAVIRTHARNQIDDTQLTNALGDIADERQTLRGHLHQLNLWQQQTAANQAHLDQLQHLATDAKSRLAHPTPQEQRLIYELLQLRIQVTPDRTLDIQGSIPTHATLDPQTTNGELSEGVPRHP
jgi:DNA invertase Pin-like site-specific DNA recombinase